MHVIFVSECEKKAIKKTRAVLDRFALRIGRRTWATPATEEGLGEIRLALKRVATRQTAVACYRNDGYRRMKIIWVVGSRSAFGPDGHIACATTKVFRSSQFPEWLNFMRHIVRIAGISHDFGKTSENFMRKLQHAVDGKGTRVVDPVRHEWLSMIMMERFRDGKFENEEGARKLQVKADTVKPAFFEHGIQTPFDLLDFLVSTHHQLFYGPGGKPGIRWHVKSATPSQIKNAQNLECLLPKTSWESYKRGITKISELHQSDSQSKQWRGTAILCRAVLILADHQVSGIEYEGKGTGKPYANTMKVNGKRKYNQPLRWHLERVSRIATFLMPRIATMKLRGLSEESVARILHPSPKGMFDWQNKGVSALWKLREKSVFPVLVFNIAATGTGKTRMNAKCAAVLCDPNRVRFAIVLNQRNLTLQTGDALREQLGLPASELATIIGDKTTRKLHENAKDEDAENSTAEIEGEQYDVFFDTDNSISSSYSASEDLPLWLQSRSEKNPSFARITATPVLVATIDYLIAAGDLKAQGHHVDALLRLIDSDIILDEVDAYDPSALQSILRLIQMAGFCGRNVICSSATLPHPTAEAIKQAFESGVSMRAGMFGEDIGSDVILIDDRIKPQVYGGKISFEDFYCWHVKEMLQKHTQAFRMPYIQQLKENSVEGWKDAVYEATRKLHSINAWEYGESGKSVSFGLVRVANIKTAIHVARYLAEHIPEAQVACYHSNDFLVQRHFKERTLDRLLTRKKGNQNILSDPQIQSIVEKSDSKSIPFIVVATPVEEVGRDHDFDWAVIEPSGTQSIVQTAGRVNRHRYELRSAGQYNIAILDINFRKAKGEDSCFYAPGLESKSGQYRYSTHCMSELLNIDALQNGLDARLRFYDEHLMAREDNRLLSMQIDSYVEQLTEISNKSTVWMTSDFYKDFRESAPKQSWRLNVNDDGIEIFERLESIIGYQKKYVPTEMAEASQRFENAWLSFEPQELLKLCEKYEIEAEEGLVFEIIGSDTTEIEYDRDFGFSTK